MSKYRQEQYKQALEVLGGTVDYTVLLDGKADNFTRDQCEACPIGCPERCYELYPNLQCHDCITAYLIEQGKVEP